MFTIHPTVTSALVICIYVSFFEALNSIFALNIY